MCVCVCVCLCVCEGAPGATGASEEDKSKCLTAASCTEV